MLHGQSRPKRGDRIGEPRLMQGNHVHIALGQNQLLPPLVLCKIECKQSVTFAKNQRIRSIQIFGLCIGEHTPAKRNDIAAQVDDRIHHPAEKAVQRTSTAPFKRHIRLDHLCLLIAFLGQKIHQGKAGRRRIPQPKVTDGRLRQPAAAQIGKPRRALLGH